MGTFMTTVWMQLLQSASQRTLRRRSGVAFSGPASIERLEAREVPTLVISPAVGGVMTIRGTDASENAEIRIDRGIVSVSEQTSRGTVTSSRDLRGVRELNVATIGGDDQVRVSVVGSASQLQVLGVYGGNGRDFLTVDVQSNAASINTINLAGQSDSDGLAFIARGSVSSALKSANISGGGGDDALYAIVDAAFASDAKLNMWGEDGHDSVTVDIRRLENVARVAVDGGAGTDRLSIPSQSAKVRFWTDVESISIADARKLLNANGNIGTPYRRLVDIPIRSGAESRSYDKYLGAIEQFSNSLAVAGRYLKVGDQTWCNIFADDVIGGAMNVALPAKDNDPSMAKGSNQLFDYFSSGANGWRALRPEEIAAHVRSGRPAVAVWKNPVASQPGHIAVIRPDQDLSTITTSDIGRIVIAQAGRFNSARTTVASGFSGVRLSEVRFFGHA